jgi:protein O-GlcNAc transferase
LEAFVAHDKTEFVEKGLYWADHLTELAKIRDELRERFGQSAMGQPDIIAAALERALRTMWQRWCAGLPAESFEVHRQATDNAMQEVAK